MQIELTESEIYWFASGLQRYAMGRMTYVTTLAGELIEKVFPYIDPEHRRQLIIELQTTIQRFEDTGVYLGHKMDHDGWKETLIRWKHTHERLQDEHETD